jgi:glycolate oxidase FAD binding subunit
MKPVNEHELSDAIKSADSNVRIIGGGTRQDLGNPVLATHELHTSALTGITLLEPAALTLVVRAGTPLADVQAALEAENQQLPFEPMDHRALLNTTGTPTIGGAVACNISGPRRIQAGACRDSLIGVRFVDGAGNIVKNGGRVMKNVTGYDLVKLMAGSYGTLGVMTGLSFKLAPKPAHVATICLHNVDDETGVGLLSHALGSPNDVSGAAYNDGTALIRIEGLPKSVTYRTEALKSLFKDQDISTLDTDASRTLWKSIGDVTKFADHEGAVWRLSVKPTNAPVIVAKLRNAGITLDTHYDWGGGLVYLLVDDGIDIRNHLGGLKGHASLIRGNGGGASPLPPQNTLVQKLETGLREKFDPRGILNTGIMG